MAKRRNIGLAVAVGAGLIIIAFGDFTTGEPVSPVECDDLEAPSRNVTCFEVPVEGATLAVAVIHAGDEALVNTPVVMLPALPGETPIADIDRYARTSLAGNHDIVLVDPRGAGRSSPFIDCPDLELDPGSLDLLERCREDLLDADTDLITIGTDTTVADLDAIRTALSQGRSWGRWHVVGSGYGSQLGYRLAQSFGSGVESLTMSSAIPVDVPSITASAQSLAPGLDAITALCQQQRGCSKFGLTTAAVFRITGRLDTSPEPLEIPRLDGAERGNVVSVDGSMARVAVWRTMRDESLVTLLPWAADRIDAAASEFGMERRGRETLAVLIAATVRKPAVSEPVFWTIVCSEQIPALDEALLAELVTVTPELVAPMDPAEACPVWGVPRAEVRPTDDPINTRTMVVTSPTDPAVKRTWADEIAAGIEGSLVMEVGSLGWAPGSSECESELLTAFMDDAASAQGIGCAQDSLSFATNPVPLAGANFQNVADKAGPFALVAIGTLMGAGFAVWTWSGPIGGFRMAWAVVVAGTMAFVLLTGAVLVFGITPDRLVAQPQWAWPIVLLPWALVPVFGVATFLTAKATFDARLRAPWPARYLVLGIGVALAGIGAVMAGMVFGT